ncbi:hypothetical protein DUNSADRAFT_3790 [Dunaliella salina]|uniref:Uncharacterized protein n=1 Tax=Dunaliella salina TaxID=3046 RepID=A0ABQ7GT92_DUNSA|nr:hypothetical protein DUNSADRAFT_3790 [Dunaliella salina]|eukprot:KAF5837827.1 hypothetical protein DUNSADRAFT_3790 [Dunaliella salina]
MHCTYSFPLWPQDFFKYLDVLVFVEATIYQLDEDNEALAARGHAEPGRQLLEESVLTRVLEGLGLMDDGIKAGLKQGDVYWEGERKLCSAMRSRGCIPSHPTVIIEASPVGQENGLSSRADPAGLAEQQSPGQEASKMLGELPKLPDPRQHKQWEHQEQQAPWQGFTLEEALAVHESKSFDYRVMHLILWKLVGRQPQPSLLAFLKVDELLVDIGDDLTDYEDDVERNSFNIFRCYAHLFGADAPCMLVQRISDLEQLHAQLLARLPPHLQAHWQTRHKEASVEGGSCDGGSWEFPSVIYDEAAFREDED